MTEKQLKRLSRRELLELLITQTRKTEALEKQLKDVQAQLQEKHLIMEKAGSIAQAAMQLNGVFEAAQKAADQYLESIQHLCGQEQS